MPKFASPRALLALAASTTLSLLVGSVPSVALAQTVTLTNGGSCTYSAATYTVASNSWNFTCTGGGGATTATMSFGPVSGSLSTAGASSATIAVSCGGAGCAGLTSTPSVVSPAGVTVSGSIVNGVGVITVSSAAALAPGNATINFTAPTGAGSGISVTPTTATQVNVPITTPVTSTLGFQTATAAALVGDGAVAINIVRSAAAAEAASVAFSCVDNLQPANYPPPIAPGGRGTFYWAPGDASAKAIYVTPIAIPGGVASASVTCTLNSPTGAGLGTSSFTLSITPPGNGPPPGCPAVANVQPEDLGIDGTRKLGMGGTSSAGIGSTSIKFSPVRHGKGRGITTATMPASGYWPPNNYAAQFAINECPGVFDPMPGQPWQCSYFSAGTNAIQIDWKTSAAGSSWACQLDPNKNYYVNIRYIDSAGASTCSSGSCAAYVDFTWQ